MARKITRHIGFTAKVNAERSKFIIERFDNLARTSGSSRKIIDRALNGRRSSKTKI